MQVIKVSRATKAIHTRLSKPTHKQVFTHYEHSSDCVVCVFYNVTAVQPTKRGTEFPHGPCW